MVLHVPSIAGLLFAIYRNFVLCQVFVITGQVHLTTSTFSDHPALTHYVLYFCCQKLFKAQSVEAVQSVTKSKCKKGITKGLNSSSHYFLFHSLSQF